MSLSVCYNLKYKTNNYEYFIAILFEILVSFVSCKHFSVKINEILRENMKQKLTKINSMPSCV